MIRSLEMKKNVLLQVIGAVMALALFSAIAVLVLPPAINPKAITAPITCNKTFLPFFGNEDGLQ